MKYAVITLLILASLSSAQQPVTLHSGNYAHAGVYGTNSIVRSSTGTLYMVRIEEVASSRPIKLYSSTNNGGSWAAAFPTIAINTASSGLVGTVMTNHVDMAIDDLDQLHITFANYKYPSSFASWYRRIDTTTGGFSALVDLRTAGGSAIPPTVRSSACAIAIGPQGEVHIAAATSTSWKTQILTSTQPYAANDTFVASGVISSTASAQHVSMAVDSTGLVQCIYYENTGSGDFRHRTFDPSTMTFGPATDLGDLQAPNDNWGAIATDALGNTHMVCVRNAGGSASSNHPDLVYYMRDPSGVFSGPVNVSSATNAQLGSSNKYVVSMTTNEGNGDCYLLYRDYATGGELSLLMKGLSNSSFAQVTQVMPPSSFTHAYYTPALHGTLWPATNRYDGTMHMTWREGSSAPYSARYLRKLSGGQVTYIPTNVVSPGSAISVSFDSPPHANQTYIPFVSCSYGQTPVPNTTLFLPVAADSCFSAYFGDPTSLFIFILGQPGSYFGTLDGSGHASGVIAMPTWISPGFSLPMIVGFLTADPGGITSVSNAEPFLIN